MNDKKENRRLIKLLDAYKDSGVDYQATSYWASYENSILETLQKIDYSKMRNGEYPILGTFGFNDVVYTYHTGVPPYLNLILKFIHKFIIKSRGILPYGMSLNTLRQLAFDFCEQLGKLNGALPLSKVSVSTYGNPQDLFQISNNYYSMAFLDYYPRYCFVQKHLPFKGNEIIVELGSGSGYQLELLKKLYPNLTILCFDLPSQLYLCEKYLSQALNSDQIVSAEETLSWANLSYVQPGKIHFFGSWKFPLLKEFNFDLFWNAASFGEMEPNVVENYLNQIKARAKWIFLLQATNGKETIGKTRVMKKTTLEDYSNYLKDYHLVEMSEANRALGKIPGYFQALWKNNRD